jgi:hypothetical protein
MLIPVRDIVFVREVRDPNDDSERAARMPRLTWTKERPFTAVVQGQWLVLTGKRRAVRTPMANVVDALEFGDDLPRELAELMAAADKPAKGGGK